MNFSLPGAVSAVVLALVGASAQAAFVDVNLAGWKSFADFGDPANTSVFLNIGAGSFVTGYNYTGLAFSTSNGSYLSEFVLSVDDQVGVNYMDWVPSEVDASGSSGSLSGSFGGPTGYGAGAPFAVANGVLWVTVYELYDDPGLDATVSAGSLRIFYNPAIVGAVPEPATWALMGLGLLGVGAVARRRIG